MSTTDECFERFAAHFTGAPSPNDEIALPSLLDRARLDYSLESLHEVDRYLTALHARRAELCGRPLFHTVLWGGAYVGEVIRGVAAKGRANVVYETFRWVDYDDYVAEHPAVVPLVGPRDVATYAFLVRRSGAMNLPLSKVQSCIANGLEDSVHFHADCELKSAIRMASVGPLSPAAAKFFAGFFADGDDTPSIKRGQ